MGKVQVKEKGSSNLEAIIIWEPYENDEIFSRKNSSKDDSDNYLNNNQKVDINIANKNENKKELLLIEPHIPLNNYLQSGDYILSSYWKSANVGGVAGGIGNQNISFKFDYGLSDSSLFSIYLSETDDPLYNLIEGKKVPNYWGSAAFSYKKRIFESYNKNNAISIAGSLEYWNVSSGSSEASNLEKVYITK